eukprot:scaffold147662_cov19-Tisochrysis_lutea.AAC.1
MQPRRGPRAGEAVYGAAKRKSGNKFWIEGQGPAGSHPASLLLSQQQVPSIPIAIRFTIHSLKTACVASEWRAKAWKLAEEQDFCIPTSLQIREFRRRACCLFCPQAW